VSKVFEMLVRAIRRVDGEPASKEEEAWRKREARRRQRELAERERQMKYQQQALEIWKRKIKRKAKKEERRRKKGMKLLDKKLTDKPDWLQQQFPVAAKVCVMCGVDVVRCHVFLCSARFPGNIFSVESDILVSLQG
jgi:hypothetical protein